MYKLFLHHSERKSIECIDKYMAASPRICKEFESHMVEKKIDGKMVMVRSWCFISEDQDCPDLLVKKGTMERDQYYYDGRIEKITDHCAMEHKFGMDLVNSLNSDLLEDELTRMKRKFIKEDKRIQFYGGTYLNTTIPLYLVIVNELISVDRYGTPEHFTTSRVDLARAYGIAQDLNIRCVYCDDSHTFAKKVFSLIRTPPKEVDLGQRFVIKSSGSDWNRALQSYHLVSKEVANKIEGNWNNLIEFAKEYIAWEKLNKMNDPNFYWYVMKKCFTTDSGRFMKANMEKFLRKVSGK